MPKSRSILKYVIHRDSSFSNIMFSANVLFQYMKKQYLGDYWCLWCLW